MNILHPSKERKKQKKALGIIAKKKKYSRREDLMAVVFLEKKSLERAAQFGAERVARLINSLLALCAWSVHYARLTRLLCEKLAHPLTRQPERDARCKCYIYTSFFFIALLDARFVDFYSMKARQ